MKQPIAMRCTKKQFKAIKPKLLEISEIGMLLGAFEEYKYLTNNYISGDKKIFDFIGKGSLWENEHQNNIYEEWNEKIFLEACGIEVENSKHPSLEEVKEHFKNAKTIQCLDDKDEYILDLNQDFDFKKTCIWLLNQVDKPFSGSNSSCMIWSLEYGFAKILTYKEKTFSITESQIKELYKITEIHSAQKFIENLFPETVESGVKELKVGTWYWAGETLFNYQLGDDIFGFDDDGQWSKAEKWCWRNEPVDREATKQEVFEALKNEAVKRGFVQGNFIKNNGLHSSCKENKLVKNPEFDFQDGGLWIDNCGESEYSCLIFEKGKWAEIIPTITLSEAEHQLGKKIIV